MLFLNLSRFNFHFILPNGALFFSNTLGLVSLIGASKYNPGPRFGHIALRRPLPCDQEAAQP